MPSSKAACIIAYRCFRWKPNTPWKINMEPTNHPFGKENDLNQTSIIMVQPLIFQGVENHTRNSPKSQKNPSKGKMFIFIRPILRSCMNLPKKFYSHLSSSPESPTKKNGLKSLHLTESWQQKTGVWTWKLGWSHAVLKKGGLWEPNIYHRWNI